MIDVFLFTQLMNPSFSGGLKQDLTPYNERLTLSRSVKYLIPK